MGTRGRTFAEQPLPIGIVIFDRDHCDIVATCAALANDIIFLEFSSHCKKLEVRLASGRRAHHAPPQMWAVKAPREYQVIPP